MTSDSFRIQYLLSPLSKDREVVKLSMGDERIGSSRPIAFRRMESHRKARQKAEQPLHLAFLTISLAETSPCFASE